MIIVSWFGMKGAPFKVLFFHKEGWGKVLYLLKKFMSKDFKNNMSQHTIARKDDQMPVTSDLSLH